MSTSRNGILAGGNWIVDAVKIIDTWPQQDALANILSTARGTGGSPFNVLVDLALLGVDFPLSAAGLVGEDENGRWIVEQCEQHAIDTAALLRTDAAPTSYTDVMTVRTNGRRTFFHARGANALLDSGHFDFRAIPRENLPPRLPPPARPARCAERHTRHRRRRSPRPRVRPPG